MLAENDLERAADELEIAVKYDASNKLAADELAIVRRRIQARSEEQRRLSEFEAMRTRAQAMPCRCRCSRRAARRRSS